MSYDVLIQKVKRNVHAGDLFNGSTSNVSSGLIIYGTFSSVAIAQGYVDSFTRVNPSFSVAGDLVDYGRYNGRVMAVRHEIAYGAPGYLTIGIRESNRPAWDTVSEEFMIYLIEQAQRRYAHDFSINKRRAILYPSLYHETD